jgi:hypothetical protein
MTKAHAHLVRGTWPPKGVTEASLLGEARKRGPHSWRSSLGSEGLTLKPEP